MQQLIIYGLTTKGQKFRPSDWAERLAGVMAQFRPPGIGFSHLTYSPYVIPSDKDGHKCLIVDERLRQLEPRAWKFVNDFAIDNDLTVETIGESEFE